MSKDVKVFMSESDFDNLSKAGALLKEINSVHNSKLTILSTQNIMIDETGEFKASASVYNLCEGDDELLSSEDSSSFSLYLRGYKCAMDKAVESMRNAFNLDSLDEDDVEEIVEESVEKNVEETAEEEDIIIPESSVKAPELE